LICEFFAAVNKRLDWERYALLLACAATSRSEDPLIKVGSCALRYDFSVAGVGYNGLPSKVEGDYYDDETRQFSVIHSEINALRYCKPGEIAILAVTLQPCSRCVTEIAAYGIKRVVYLKKYWRDPRAHKLCKKFHISISQLTLPQFIFPDFCAIHKLRD
jgi:deoxycytidylate deaminase